MQQTNFLKIPNKNLFFETTILKNVRHKKIRIFVLLYQFCPISSSQKILFWFVVELTDFSIEDYNQNISEQKFSDMKIGLKP